MFCLSSFPVLGSGVRAAAPEVCCWCEKCAGLMLPAASPPRCVAVPSPGRAWGDLHKPCRAPSSPGMGKTREPTGSEGQLSHLPGRKQRPLFVPFPGLVVWWQPQRVALVEGLCGCGCRGILAPIHITPHSAGSSPCPVRFLCFTW